MDQRIVIFDLDGTIVDNHVCLLQAFEQSFNAMNIPYPGNEEIKKRFGKDLDTILREIGLAEEQIGEFRRKFSDSLSKCHDFSLVEGIKKLLHELKEEGVRLAIVTSKSKNLVENELKHFNLDQLFDVIVDESSTKNHKPDPEPLLKACELLEVKPNKSIPYVGDSMYDQLAAQRAGLLPVGVTWGVHGDLVSSLVPETETIKSVSQLKDFLQNHLN